MFHGDDDRIFQRCPLCGDRLSGGFAGPIECAKGHYKYQTRGSYASACQILVDEEWERFVFDDMFGDGEKFRKRIVELREQGKAETWC